MTSDTTSFARRNARKLAVVGGTFAVVAVTASVFAFAGVANANGNSDDPTIRQVPGTDSWIVEDRAEVPIDGDGGPSSMVVEGSGAADDADIVSSEAGTL